MGDVRGERETYFRLGHQGHRLQRPVSAVRPAARTCPRVATDISGYQAAVLAVFRSRGRNNLWSLGRLTTLIGSRDGATAWRLRASLRAVPRGGPRKSRSRVLVVGS
jgi:hypothetical protein